MPNARARSHRAMQANARLPAPPLNGTPRQPGGSLLIIGGNENKDGHRPILEELARRVGSGTLVVATLATDQPEDQWKEYRRVFRDLGVRHIEQLDVRRREDLLEDPRLELLDKASAVFFAGGDQLKITSRFGGTPLCDRMRELYARGGTIAGTSSGASVMSETMMVAGNAEASHPMNGSLRMAPGLGLMPGVIIDQHFAERGRMGRLLGAVAQNPRLIGIGIDEDTAATFDGQRHLRVLGSGAVYIVDGRTMAYTNAAEDAAHIASAYGMTVHVLTKADSFDLETREPKNSTPPDSGGRPRKQRH
jgi:cyanophycinase